jgi:dipeptidyl aminopeptidase/acylaminoacyl peptidase
MRVPWGVSFTPRFAWCFEMLAARFRRKFDARPAGRRARVRAEAVILSLLVPLACLPRVAHSTAAQPSRAAAHGLRSPAIGDFLDLRQVEEVSPSPDASMLAVVVTRRRSGHIEGELPGDRHRTDIYIIEVRTRKLVTIIRPPKGEGSSFWGPLWSPDGTRLALLTDEGRAHSLVRPAVWSTKTRRLVVLGQRSVDFRVNWGDQGTGQWTKWGMWTDAGTLMTVLLRPGALADSIRLQAPETPALDWNSLWQLTMEGKRAVTVWRSPSSVVCGGHDEMVTLNLLTGEQRVVYRGSVRGVSVAPDGRFVAIIGAIPRTPPPVVRQDVWFEARGSWEDIASIGTTLTIVGLRDGVTLGQVRGVGGLRPTVHLFPVGSANDTAVAVPAHPCRGCDVVYYIRLPNLRVSRYVAGNALSGLVLAQILTMQGHAATKGAWNRWRVHLPVKETENWDDTAVQNVPGQVIRLDHDRVGILLKGTLTVLDKFGHTVAVANGVGETLIYPEAAAAVEGDAVRVVAEDADGTVNLVNLRGEVPEVMKIGHVPAGASVNALLRGNDFVFSDSEPKETDVAMQRGGKVEQLLTLNRFLSRIELPEQALISYSLGSGERVLGRLWLPPGYRRGVKRPLIVFGYPEFYVRGTEKNPFRDLWMYPEVLLAAAGYLVLQPTVPRRPNDRSSEYDPIAYYSAAVIAAVRAAIKQGYADPERLGYYGHSYGGYLGLSLEARTRLFQAIVVVSPFANLIEMHDTPEPSLTSLNECTPNVLVSAGILYLEADGATLDMGGPPWLKFGRYVRNSPSFNLRDATTPLLMEKGQFDGDLPAIRGVFAELDRKGVPAELAVYWEEGHLLRTRGNVMDGWARSLGWFDRWLRHKSAAAERHSVSGAHAVVGVGGSVSHRRRSGSWLSRRSYECCSGGPMLGP